MNIQVSKVFAKFINKTAKEMGFECEAKVITLPERSYTFYTGTDLLDALRDYAGDGRFKVIMVDYPPEYYACTKFVSTYELVREFRKRGVETTDELKEMLRDMLEI